VSSFADGTTDGRNWGLRVVLRDGREIAATATRGQPGDTEILTEIRRVANLRISGEAPRSLELA